MKLTILLLAAIAVITLTGCQTARQAYKDSPITPDGFNYTAARDRATGDWCDYWGLSWSLK